MQKIQYYRGIKFIRYENQKYYCMTTNAHILLHRFIWECEKGAIPKGYDVHHIDHDFDHNELSNFELLTRKEHIKRHFDEMPEDKKEMIRNNMRKARFSQKCISALKSKEFSEKMSNQTKRLWQEGKMTKPNNYVCEICGKTYSRRSKPAKHRFCSYECQRVYEKTPVQKICVICKKPFQSFLGSAGSTCSRSCASILNHQRRN